MLHAQASSSVLTVSPPDTFSPRREFVRESDHVSSSFALLAVAGAGFVRLSSFSRELVATLRRAFELRQILGGIREETNLNLVEFNLRGKPWTQTKNIESEKIFVEILAVILQHGYVFLSTIDYGRERDDRVSIAFSKPISTPCVPTRAPFALSFPSSTVLRVINPPLSFSPAIIQAARSAWPRGVISEGTVSEKCYEFRLKGYRWFQEDNFSADSLHQIFHLLSELDLHAFSLLTSITLSGNHSRVKDLWIFSGPPSEASSDSITNGLNVELPHDLSPSGLKNVPYPILTSSLRGTNNFGDTLHVRSGSSPGSLPGSSSTLAHARSSTEPNASSSYHRTPPISGSVLRKKSTFRPVGTIPSPLGRSSSEEFSMRGPDIATNERVDMTGIGSGGQRNLSAARGTGTARSPSPRPPPHASAGPDTHRNQQDASSRVKTGDVFYETGFDNNYSMYSSAGGIHDEFQPPGYPAHPPSQGSSSESRDLSRQLTPRDSTELSNYVPQSVCGYSESGTRTDSTPPILNPAVFRDSAFSSATSHSYEVPITWTGMPDLDKGKERGLLSGPRPPAEYESPAPETDGGYNGGLEDGPEKLSRPSQRISTAPRFTSSGGWQPTPIDEIPEDLGRMSFGDPQRRTARDRSPERREVDAERVTSPILMSSDKLGATRKSEVAQYDVIAGRSLPPSTPITSKTDGWVLVNVAESTLDSGNIRISDATSSLPGTSALSSSLSPVVKAIAAEDAASSTSQRYPQGTSGLRRFLPGSKVKSRSAATNTSTTRVKASEQEKKARKPSLKEKWRKKTTLDT
ncbi:hypothetical protein M0805_004809 [Coniferiporia weirii]|nr:hypothetical protein M0805_004809 [Coniferiporia weirii]